MAVLWCGPKLGIGSDGNRGSGNDGSLYLGGGPMGAGGPDGQRGSTLLEGGGNALNLGQVGEAVSIR